MIDLLPIKYFNSAKTFTEHFLGQENIAS